MMATGKNDETPVLARFLAVFGRELRERWRFCLDLCVPRHSIVSMQPAPSLIAFTVDDLRRHAPLDAKHGAIDFIEKPFDDKKIVVRAKDCLFRDQHLGGAQGNLDAKQARLALLTHRELVVMYLVISA